ncbi:hypothetical protein HOD08_02015 [bacterium]|nr:hypothetical protein [bacterium]
MINKTLATKLTLFAAIAVCGTVHAGNTESTSPKSPGSPFHGPARPPTPPSVSLRTGNQHIAKQIQTAYSELGEKHCAVLEELREAARINELPRPVPRGAPWFPPNIIPEELRDFWEMETTTETGHGSPRECLPFRMQSVFKWMNERFVEKFQGKTAAILSENTLDIDEMRGYKTTKIMEHLGMNTIIMLAHVIKPRKIREKCDGMPPDFLFDAALHLPGPGCKEIIAGGHRNATSDKIQEAYDSLGAAHKAMIEFVCKCKVEHGNPQWWNRVGKVNFKTAGATARNALGIESTAEVDASFSFSFIENSFLNSFKKHVEKVLGIECINITKEVALSIARGLQFNTMLVFLRTIPFTNIRPSMHELWVEECKQRYPEIVVGEGGHPFNHFGYDKAALHLPGPTS